MSGGMLEVLVGVDIYESERWRDKRGPRRYSTKTKSATPRMPAPTIKPPASEPYFQNTVDSTSPIEAFLPVKELPSNSDAGLQESSTTGLPTATRTFRYRRWAILGSGSADVYVR
jgi:hypothetical protein